MAWHAVAPDRPARSTQSLRLQSPARIYSLDSLPNPLTALEVACLTHAGLQMAEPGTDSRFPLEGVYGVVMGARQ